MKAGSYGRQRIQCRLFCLLAVWTAPNTPGVVISSPSEISDNRLGYRDYPPTVVRAVRASSFARLWKLDSGHHRHDPASCP